MRCQGHLVQRRGGTLGFPGATCKQWHLFFFFSGFGAGRGCPYSESTLLQQAEDTGSSGFCPHLALGALAEATMRKSGHTGTLKGTEGLSHSLSLFTFSTLQPEQSPQLPVTPENTLAPRGTSVSLS